MCSEMSISYTDMLNLTWREYAYYLGGYKRKIDRGWDYTRHMIANMYNSSGFAKTKYKAEDFMKLESLDFVRPAIIEKVDVMRILRR